MIFQFNKQALISVRLRTWLRWLAGPFLRELAEEGRRKVQGERLGFSGWSPGSSDSSLGIAGHLWDILSGFSEPGVAARWV